MVSARRFARLFGRLSTCSPADFRDAAIEVAVICLSAFIPLWAGLGVFALMTIPGAVARYGVSFMTSGEMLLISCAIIGPTLYVITKRYGNFIDPLTLRFPYSTGFSVIIVMVWFISGGIFVFKKVMVGTSNVIDAGAMWYLSLGISLISVFILYFATVFRNSMMRADAGALMHEQQEKFVRDFGNG